MPTSFDHVHNLFHSGGKSSDFGKCRRYVEGHVGVYSSRRECQQHQPGLPFAVVQSPAAARLTVDGSPGSAIYAGYSMALNMGNTIKNSNPFLLREWATPGATSALLSSSGAWANLTGGGIGSPILSGYVDGTSYTFMMQFKLLSGGDLEISSSMMGGTLNGGAGLSLVYTDSTPNSLTFDTVAIRPSFDR